MITRNRLCLTALTALCGLAAPAAFAQDSVSVNPDAGNGLPGDALDPYNVAQQCARFVVDLTGFQTRCGTRFNIAPIVKSSKLSPAFFSSLISSQAISKVLLGNIPFAGGYSLWNGAGPGVNLGGVLPPNTPGANVAPMGPSNQFAVAFSEFGSTPSRINNIIGAMVNYAQNQPRRLYLHRIVAAQNQPSAVSGDFSQLGLGSADSSGNIYFRADGFGSTGVPLADRITGQNIFRVDLPARNCGGLNLINQAGGANSDAAATQGVVRGNALTHNTPSCIPESVAGRPVYMGATFGTAAIPGSFRHESAPLVVTSSQFHLFPSGTTGDAAGEAVDHRGGVSAGPKIFPAPDNSVGSAAVLLKSFDRRTGVVSGPTDTIGVWGVDSNGTITTAARLIMPLALNDPCDIYAHVQNFAGQPDSGFDGYHNQTAFRGGNGLVAVGRDQAGRGLVAATLYDSITSGNDNPCNHIAVCRFDPANPEATAQWTLAAWNDCNLANGKPLCGPTGGPIGELCTLLEVTGGVSPSPIGPSVSAPMMDSVGNLYFLAAVQLYNGADDDLAVVGDPVDSFTSALIRAVYDPAAFCYRLDVVFTNGQVFAGQNSTRNWKIIFLSIANQQTSPGLSSGTTFSGNIMQTSWSNAPTAPMATSNPATMGGLVLQASIIYDVDQDTDFQDPLDMGPGANPNSVDEAYNVLLFIGADAIPCPADLNGDGVVGAGDLALVLGSWNNLGGPADLDGSGVVGAGDVAQLLGAWGPCPTP